MTMFEAPQPSEKIPVNGATKRPRKAREPVGRFPDTFTLSISRPMANSLLRMCPPGAPFNQSTYLRMVLHSVLLRDDPQYRNELGNNGHA